MNVAVTLDIIFSRAVVASVKALGWHWQTANIY